MSRGGASADRWGFCLGAEHLPTGSACDCMHMNNKTERGLTGPGPEITPGDSQQLSPHQAEAGG